MQFNWFRLMKSSTFDSGLSSQDHDSFIMRDKVVAEKSQTEVIFVRAKKKSACMLRETVAVNVAERVT